MQEAAWGKLVGARWRQGSISTLGGMVKAKLDYPLSPRQWYKRSVSYGCVILLYRLLLYCYRNSYYSSKQAFAPYLPPFALVFSTLRAYPLMRVCLILCIFAFAREYSCGFAAQKL